MDTTVQLSDKNDFIKKLTISGMSREDIHKTIDKIIDDNITEIIYEIAKISRGYEVMDDNNGIYKTFNLKKLRNNPNLESEYLDKIPDYVGFDEHKGCNCNNMGCPSWLYNDDTIHYCPFECMIDGEYSMASAKKTIREYINDGILCDNGVCNFYFKISHSDKYYKKEFNMLLFGASLEEYVKLFKDYSTDKQFAIDNKIEFKPINLEEQVYKTHMDRLDNAINILKKELIENQGNEDVEKEINKIIHFLTEYEF